MLVFWPLIESLLTSCPHKKLGGVPGAISTSWVGPESFIIWPKYHLNPWKNHSAYQCLNGWNKTWVSLQLGRDVRCASGTWFVPGFCCGIFSSQIKTLNSKMHLKCRHPSIFLLSKGPFHIEIFICFASYLRRTSLVDVQNEFHSIGLVITLQACWWEKSGKPTGRYLVYRFLRLSILCFIHWICVRPRLRNKGLSGFPTKMK